MTKLSLSALKANPKRATLAVATKVEHRFSSPKQDRIAFSSNQQVPAAQPDAVHPHLTLENVENLLPHQVAPVINCVNSLLFFGSWLDASDTGVGKTYMALAVARELGIRPLIVCPLSLKTTWKTCAEFMGVELLDVVNYESIKGGKREWLKLVNPPGAAYNRLRARKEYQWFLPSDAVLIFDEVHRCKGQHSHNCDMLLAAKKQNIRVGGLSATAACSPLEMRAIGFMLGLHKLHDFWRWCRDHGASDGNYGGLHFDRESEQSQKVMLNIHKQIFPKRGSRVRVRDLGDAFPESQISACSYDMGAKSDAITKAYDEMAAEMAKINEHTANYSGQIFAIMMAARMKAEMLKVPTFVELIKDGIDEDMSIAVFLNFTQSIEAVTTRIPGCALIVGGQKQHERDSDIAAFQADEKRVIVANIAAGGVGVSLHDLNGRYPRLSLISPNYSAVQLKQALGRVWRSGGKTKSIQKIVFAAKTIEEQACRSVNAKLRNLNLLNDGDLTMGFKL